MSQPNHRAIRPHEQLGPPIFGGRLNFRQLADGAAEPQTGASRQGRLLAKKEELCLDCVGHTGNKGGQTACQLFTNAGSDGL
jgi:hypothetical protein